MTHDDVVIPAQRRLYKTATRKVLGVGGDDSVVSTDDEKIYGPVVSRFTTSQGIERGLLADHRVLVMVVTDAQVRELTQAEDPHLQVGANQAVDSFVDPAGMPSDSAAARRCSAMSSPGNACGLADQPDRDGAMTPTVFRSRSSAPTVGWSICSCHAVLPVKPHAIKMMAEGKVLSTSQARCRDVA